MRLLKEHITFKILTIVIVATLLIPSVVKFAHMLTYHKHEVCKNNQTIHIHNIDFDCELCKFNINKVYYQTTQIFKFIELPTYPQFIFGLYNFKYYHQQLSFSLRGPPELLA